MKKKCLKRMFMLCAMALLIPLCGCTKSQVETDGKIQGNDGSSISYLTQVEEKAVINVFNFNQRKVVKTMQSNAQIQNNGFCPYGLSYYSPSESKTLILSQNEEPYGYQVYMQDQREIKNIGLIKGGSSGAVFKGNDLYAVVHLESDVCEIQKYRLSDLDRPVKTWELKGEPQKILMDEKSGNVYVLCTELGKRVTLTKVDMSGNCTHEEILNEAYHVDAAIEKNQIWIACQCTLGESADKNKSVKKLFGYDLETGKITKRLEASHHPSIIRVMDERIYLLSNEGETDFVERVNWKTGKREQLAELEYGTRAVAFVVNEKGKFLFTNAGIYCLEGSGYRACVKADGPMNRVETDIL